MNKRALYESIMRHVAREVKKTLNEGKFSEWRQTNAPAFDFEKFKKCLFDVVSTCKGLFDDDQIRKIALIQNSTSGEKFLINEVSALGEQSDIRIFVEDCMKKIQEMGSGKHEQATILKNSIFAIITSKGSELESYLFSQKTSNNKLKNFNYGECILTKDNKGIVLMFTVTEIMEHSQEIKDFLE